MNQTRDVAALAGRVLLALMFVFAGYGKIGGFEDTAAYIASKHLPLPPVATAIAIVVELVGGLMVVVGWKARWAALAVAVFTVFATILFHNFWAMTDAATADVNRLMFLKNVAVIGGLLILGAFGPGRYSLDRG
ncbi:MAG: DoxX family protein [Betaproteobacteria bacterium]